MKTIMKVGLLSLLAIAVSSCARGYDTHHSGHYGSAQVYERMPYSTVYVETPYPAYSRTTSVGSHLNSYSIGGMGGGGMH
jgi:hypothetical protein